MKTVRQLLESKGSQVISVTPDTPVFDALTPAQQQRMTDAAHKAFAWSTAEYLKQEQELVAFFKSAGLDVYTPDVSAFRSHAQKQYLQSPLSKSWPPGMLDKINAL